MMLEAEAQMAGLPDAPVIALYSENWSPSLVGLVAGRCADRTGKPAIAIGKSGERWVGSGRSFAWYDITAAIARAGEGLLLHSGGHVQACGFSFTDTSRMQELFLRLQQDAASMVDAHVAVPSLNIDMDVTLEHLDWQLIDHIELLQPFGEQQRRPIFATYNVQQVRSDIMGQTQKHARFSLRSDGGRMLKFVGFNMADRVPALANVSRVDVAYELGVNEWNGKKEIQCKLVDIRPAQAQI